MAKRLPPGHPRGRPGRKPDNVPPPRSAFYLEFAKRLKQAREDLGRQRGHAITQREMAELLSRAVGYEIDTDDYRKYESPTNPSMMPADLIFHFAEITGKTAGTLLAPLPFERPARAA